MNPALRYLVLSVMALGAACDNQANDLAGPRAAEPGSSAPALAATTAPGLLLDSHALYYCSHPGATRNCVVTQRTVRIRSSIGPVNWTASKDQPWIALSATSGTTPTTVTIKATAGYVPLGASVVGTVTITAAGARYSPQKVKVVVNYFAAAPSPPLLAFSDSAIGFCYNPSSTGGCVRLAERLLFTSTGASLHWKAVSSKPWIVVHPDTAATDTDVRVSVDRTKLPATNGATSLSGAITVSASGAQNSPQTIPVKLQFYSTPPPQ
jgi:Viral BACON domain